jgi:hypothetical protein
MDVINDNFYVAKLAILKLMRYNESELNRLGNNQRISCI